MKGGYWGVGEYTIDGKTANNTASVTGLSYQPIGISLIGTQGAASTGGTAVSAGTMTIGAGTSPTDRGGVAVRDNDGQGTMVVEVGTAESKVLIAFSSPAGTIGLAYDIASINSDGFTIIVNPANAGASNVVSHGYMTFAGTTTITGQIKVWSGSAWVAKPMKVWNGSTWVTKPVKYWNGSSWIVTPY